MSQFLFRLGRRCARHPWRVLGVWLMIAAVVVGIDDRLGGTTKDNFTVPGVEAQQADDLLNDNFPQFSGLSGQLVFHVDGGSITDPSNADAVADALAEVARTEDVTAVSDPYDPRGPAISADGTTAFSTVYFSLDALEAEHTESIETAAEISREAGVQTELGGGLVAVEVEGNEDIGLIVAVVVLLFAFGSLIAMAVPIVTALFALALGLSGVGIMAYAVDTPVTSTMLASMIGLGVGIDYALFIVTRHRQNLADGMSVEDAAGVANATAGQSVLFAGMTVVIAITGLVMAGMPAMTYMGFAAAIVVLFSMAIAVTLLPACLGFAGRNIDRWSIPHRKDRSAEGHRTFAARWADHVGTPPVALRDRQPAHAGGDLGAGARPRDGLRRRLEHRRRRHPAPGLRPAHRRFRAGLQRPVHGGRRPGPIGATPRRSERSRTPSPPTPGWPQCSRRCISESGSYRVHDGPADDVAPGSRDRRDDAAPSRSTRSPLHSSGTDADAFVGGRTAMQADLSDRISDRLLAFILVVIALSFVLLMMVFRSVMVPLKAAIMNMLSIGAAYGVIVAVFQWGWAKGLVGLDATVPVNPFVPMIMFAVLFGLSMDYEVFLLSRVREEYQRTGDSHQSVVDGLAATARVITSAALIMISVFLAFVATDDVTVKMFGLGLATAVFVDATLVRMVLVPSTMSLLGSANWWLPRWLDRVLPHMDFEGGDFSAQIAGPEHGDADLDAEIAREFPERELV